MRVTYELCELVQATVQGCLTDVQVTLPVLKAATDTDQERFYFGTLAPVLVTRPTESTVGLGWLEMIPFHV